MLPKLKSHIKNNKRLSYFFIISIFLIIILGGLNLLIRNNDFRLLVGAYEEGITVSNKDFVPLAKRAPTDPRAPMINDFSATKYSIRIGESANLNWSVSRASIVKINQGIGEVNKAYGSVTVSPQVTTIYQLAAYNKFGIVTRYVIIDVLNTPPPAPTATFSANPVLIDYGSSSTLTWNTTDASSVTLDQGIGAVYPSSSLTVSPKTTTTYTLTVVNSAATITKQAIVTVTPPPAPTATFSANPTAVVQGASSTLSWSTTNATTVTLDGTNVTTTGTKSVAPTVTTTYTLKAVGAGGELTKTTTITVTPPQVVPTISSFSANPISITAGGSATLSWAITNATSASINQSIGTVSATSGTKVVSPTATTTYTLTATNSAGSKTADVVVTVTQTPALTMEHPSLILSENELNAIRNNIVENKQPWANAWTSFKAIGTSSTVNLPTEQETLAMKGNPPLDCATGSTLCQRAYFDHLNDGSKARNWALAWWFSGKQSIYLDKTKEFLLAWSRGYTPIDFTYTPDDNGDPGYLQAFGLFSFAYAYDLTYDQYSAEERQTIDSWFSKFAWAQKSNMTQQIKSLNAKYAPNALGPTIDPWYNYSWALPNGSYLKYAGYEHELGGNFITFPMLSSASAALISNDRNYLNWAFDNSNVVAYQKEVKALLNPRNQGDGIAGHPVPVPAMYINKIYVDGRGGAIDYCTYATRIGEVMVEMEPAFRSIGYTQVPTMAESTTQLKASWDYLSQFFGQSPVASPVPNDRINPDANYPRFLTPWRDLVPADNKYFDLVNYYMINYIKTLLWEPQLLGPVTLTHSIPKTQAESTRIAPNLPDQNNLWSDVKNFFTEIKSAIISFFEKLI